MENPFEIIIEKLNSIEKLLQQVNTNNQKLNVVDSSNEIMNLPQAAEFIEVTKPTMYGYTASRKIPHFKKGKKVYFKRSELIDWLLDNKIKTMDEIEREANNYMLNKGKLRR